MLQHILEAVGHEVALSRLGAEFSPRLNLHCIPRSLDGPARLGEFLHLKRAVPHVLHVILARCHLSDCAGRGIAPVQLVLVDAGDHLLDGMFGRTNVEGLLQVVNVQCGLIAQDLICPVELVSN